MIAMSYELGRGGRFTLGGGQEAYRTKKKKHLTYACIEGSFTSIPSMKGRKHLYLYLLFFIWRVWLLSVFLSPIAGVAVALAS